MVLQSAVRRALLLRSYSDSKEELRAESARTEERMRRAERDRACISRANKDRAAVAAWKNSTLELDLNGGESVGDLAMTRVLGASKMIMNDVIPGSIPRAFAESLIDMKTLGVAELMTENGKIEPYAPTERRQFVRWAVGTFEVLASDSASVIRRAERVTGVNSYDSNLAFDDVPPEDPDFDIIQVLLNLFCPVCLLGPFFSWVSFKILFCYVCLSNVFRESIQVNSFCERGHIEPCRVWRSQG